VSIRDWVIDLSKRLVSPETRNWIVRQQRRYRVQWPRMGSVNFGSLYRTTPISPIFGLDRGQPIDRYYIDGFLAKHREEIRGRCLELGDSSYIVKFGGDRVSQIDVLHVVEGNPEATIIADLTDADHVASDQFDCIIFTQSLQMIYEMKLALRTLHRILKPGGTLLLTSHGISKIGRRLGRDGWGEYWHITAQSAEALFAETFPHANVEVSTYGNVLAATCSLHGICVEEVSTVDLDVCDPDFEVLVTVRATKATEKG
jgi:SAM-dependent methyltransferase